MRAVVHVIDSISEWVGKMGRWLVVALVLVVTYGVILRYVFSKPNLWPYEVAIMLGSSLYILGLSYTYRYDRHIRVDVIYSHLAPRWRGLIDVVGSMILFFPIMLLVSYVSVTWAWDAWAHGERMAETGWYPPAGPLRTVVAVGFITLTLQGFAQFLRGIHCLRRNETYD